MFVLLCIGAVSLLFVRVPWLYLIDPGRRCARFLLFSSFLPRLPLQTTLRFGPVNFLGSWF